MFIPPPWASLTVTISALAAIAPRHTAPTSRLICSIPRVELRIFISCFGKGDQIRYAFNIRTDKYLHAYDHTFPPRAGNGLQARQAQRGLFEIDWNCLEGRAARQMPEG